MLKKVSLTKFNKVGRKATVKKNAPESNLSKVRVKAAAPLERFVRWKAAASNTNWEVCFWIAVELKSS